MNWIYKLLNINVEQFSQYKEIIHPTDEETIEYFLKFVGENKKTIFTLIIFIIIMIYLQ